MSGLIVIAQVVSVVLGGSLLLALLVGAALTVNGRIDARELLEVALGDDGPAARPRAPLPALGEPRSTGPGGGTGSGAQDLRERLSPPPR